MRSLVATNAKAKHRKGKPSERECTGCGGGSDLQQLLQPKQRIKASNTNLIALCRNGKGRVWSTLHSFGSQQLLQPLLYLTNDFIRPTRTGPGILHGVGIVILLTPNHGIKKHARNQETKKRTSQMSRKTHRPHWRPRKIFAPPRHRTRPSRTWPAEKKTDRAAVRTTTGIEFLKGFGSRTAALRCQIKANKTKIKKRSQGRLMNPREREWARGRGAHSKDQRRQHRRSGRRRKKRRCQVASRAVKSSSPLLRSWRPPLSLPPAWFLGERERGVFAALLSVGKWRDRLRWPPRPRNV